MFSYELYYWSFGQNEKKVTNKAEWVSEVQSVYLLIIFLSFEDFDEFNQSINNHIWARMTYSNLKLVPVIAESTKIICQTNRNKTIVGMTYRNNGNVGQSLNIPGAGNRVQLQVLRQFVRVVSQRVLLVLALDLQL